MEEGDGVLPDERIVFAQAHGFSLPLGVCLLLLPMEIASLSASLVFHFHTIFAYLPSCRRIVWGGQVAWW